MLYDRGLPVSNISILSRARGVYVYKSLDSSGWMTLKGRKKSISKEKKKMN